MKYIAIPVFLSGFVCSVAVARTLYYEYNDQCPGYYSTTPASGATQCSPSMRVWEIGWYDAVSKVAENGTELGNPQTLPALAQCGVASTPSGNYLDNPNDWQTYFNNPKICYPGYGYVAEGTTGNLTGFHCELDRPQADGVLHKIILKSNDGSTTYAELPYVATQCGSGYTYFVWSGSGRNSTRIGEYLPDDLVQLINNKRTGYSLRGFTTTPNVSDVASTTTDALSGTLFGTRDSASNAYYRAFPDGQTMLNGNGDIVLYASWYRDCANDACSVDTWLNGAVRYWTNCGAYAVLGGSETYNPECGYIYQLWYNCGDGTDTIVQNVTPTDTATILAASDCARINDPTHWQFDGWRISGQSGTTLHPGDNLALNTDMFSPLGGAGSHTMIVTLNAEWTGADSYATATNWHNCEQIGGKWCVTTGEWFGTNKSYNTSQLSSGQCYDPTDTGLTSMCCHDNPINCSYSQCTGNKGGGVTAGNTDLYWVVPDTPVAGYKYCTNENPNYATFSSAQSPFVDNGFYAVDLVMGNIKGFKQSSELNQNFYYAEVDKYYFSNMEVPTRRTKIRKVDVSRKLTGMHPGFQFNGWYTGENCAGTQCIDGQGNVLANSACTGTIYECWAELDDTEPDAGVVKVYIGTCDAYPRCGGLKLSGEPISVDTTGNHTRYYEAQDGSMYYGPWYTKDDGNTLYSNPDGQSGTEIKASKLRVVGTDTNQGGPGASRGLVTRLATKYSSDFSSLHTFAKGFGSGTKNRAMIVPAWEEFPQEVNVTVSCGTGTTYGSCTQAEASARGFQDVQSMQANLTPFARYIYGSYNVDYEPKYDNSPCMCVKNGKMPCGWEIKNANDEVTTVINTGWSMIGTYQPWSIFQDGAWKNIKSITAIYENCP